ncbi:hypothetical protein ACROYT_G007146 [Oculina patagonica]
MICALLVYSNFYFLEGKMYPGSVTFKQKWADFRVMPGSSQYHVMVKNIEHSIREAFKNDSNFENVKVTQLREHEATKKSTRQGNLAADFDLSFNNHSRVRNSVYNLFSMVQDGALDGIPVQEGSLFIQGLKNMTWLKHEHRTHQHLVNAIPVNRNTWPSGSYGLPKPRSGCPSKQWREGFRYQDSENLENTNLKSNGSHLSGEVSPHGVRQEFCIHMDTPGEKIPWPRGKYCIYRKGKTCPTGLQEGWIRWDDENTKIDFPSSLGGELPEGIYGENTVTSEYLQFDDEDQGNSNARSRISPYGPAEDPYNNRVYYCYYEPIPCDVTTDITCPSQTPSTDLETIFDKVVTQKPTRASKFATGGGVGMIIMGSASVAVNLRSRLRLVTSEYLQFDDEDQGNSNARSRISPYGPAEDPYNNRVYYCYYEPIPCDVTTDITCPSQAPSTDLETIFDKVVTQKPTRASKFATGGGVGMIIMGSASVAVFARRFLTRGRAS